MNKYSSGYAAISVISFFGWIVIAVSIIGGIAVLSNAPPGLGYMGWIIAVAGAVQGLLLLGMGAIGLAILDGSIAQQEVAAKKEVTAPKNERDDLMRYLVSAAIGVPGGEFLENYKGNFIIRDVAGNILVGSEIFSSVNAAKIKINSSEIEAIVTLDSMSFDADGALIFKGYRIPKKGDEFLMNGRTYTSPQKVAEQILDETPSALSKYRI
jgi:hypothetical protein